MKNIPVALVNPLNAFLTSLNKAVEIEWLKVKSFNPADVPMVAVCNVGAKYIKLARHRKQADGSWKADSVYAFIDATNGDLYKGTWKSPINGAVRGNLNDADVLTKVTTYGPAYLRGGASDTVSNILAQNLGA